MVTKTVSRRSPNDPKLIPVPCSMLLVAAVSKISAPPSSENFSGHSIGHTDGFKMLLKRIETDPAHCSKFPEHSLTQKHGLKTAPKQPEHDPTPWFGAACSCGEQNFCPPQLRKTCPNILVDTKTVSKRSPNDSKLIPAQNYIRLIATQSHNKRPRCRQAQDIGKDTLANFRNLPALWP